MLHLINSHEKNPEVGSAFYKKNWGWHMHFSG